jgi:hypothetical protein
MDVGTIKAQPHKERGLEMNRLGATIGLAYAMGFFGGIRSGVTGFDNSVAALAERNAGSLQQAQAVETAARLEAAKKLVEGYPADTFGDAVGDLHRRMTGKRAPNTEEAKAVKAILAEVAARGMTEAGGAVNTKQMASLFDESQRAQVIDYLAREQGAGVKEQVLGALAGANRLLADDTYKGALARTGVYSGATAGGAAGVAGLIELINYLQNGQQSDPGQAV